MSLAIVCVRCSKPLYYCSAIGRVFSGEPVKAEDFTPVSEGVPAPKDDDQFVCPFCGEFYAKPALSPPRADDKSVVFRLENGAWWPTPPRIRAHPRRRKSR